MIHDRHSQSIARISRQWCVNQTGVRCNVAVHQREVPPVDRADLDRLGQFGLGTIGLGDHHQSSRVLVQPMNDTGPVIALHRAQLLAVRQKRMDQSPRPVPVRRMDDNIRLFLQNDQVLILETDVQRDVFCLEIPVIAQRHLNGDESTFSRHVLLVDNLAIDPNETVIDQPGCG
jgi:hypothetical protein